MYSKVFSDPPSNTGRHNVESEEMVCVFEGFSNDRLLDEMVKIPGILMNSFIDRSGLKLQNNRNFTLSRKYILLTLENYLLQISGKAR